MTAADFNAPPAAIPLPPVDRWNPQSCGDSAMRIAADGTWFHEGEKITRPELVGLFAGLLRKDDDGYVLVTPVEKLSIAVEDVPFRAVTVDAVLGTTGPVLPAVSVTAPAASVAMMVPSGGVAPPLTVTV